LSSSGVRPAAVTAATGAQGAIYAFRWDADGWTKNNTILVGHNAAFDINFLNAAVTRTELKRNPFHPFSCFDTVSLAGAALGQTVLAKAVTVAGFAWDSTSAHSASYDAERTADLFCHVSNQLASVYREAEARACALGWHEVAPAETPSEEPTL